MNKHTCTRSLHV